MAEPDLPYPPANENGLGSGSVFAETGIVLPLVSRLFPKQQKWIPSATAVGLAWVFQWFYGLLFFIGALIGWFWQKKNAKNCEGYLFPVASGIVAGGAIMGVVLVFWENGREMLKQLF